MDHFPHRKEMLRDCYDQQAEHFVETRKKPRPELLHMQAYMQDFVKNKPSLRVAELGCGGGRLFQTLQDILPRDTHYTGIDFAPRMIASAKKKMPQADRRVGDFISFVHDSAQESLDCILGVASVQHIKGKRQRALFFADAYKALARGGCLLLTNRAYSEWFLRQYRKQIAITLPSLLLDHELVRNDVHIPRKDHKNPAYHHARYYHIFLVHELLQLARQAGFVVRVCSYVNQDGTLTDHRRYARNSFLIAEKAVE